MKLYSRLFRFSLVGVASTITHYVLLVSLAIYLSVWLANTFAFSISFLVSFFLQQRITFFDRLAGKQLNLSAAALIFVSNILTSAVAGRVFPDQYFLLLPLLPAVVNYSLFYALPRLTRFVNN